MQNDENSESYSLIKMQTKEEMKTSHKSPFRKKCHVAQSEEDSEQNDSSLEEVPTQKR